jgi:hypothetical protein
VHLKIIPNAVELWSSNKLNRYGYDDPRSKPGRHITQVNILRKIRLGASPEFTKSIFLSSAM